MRSNAYKEIAKLLRQFTLKAEFQFISDSSSLFTRFTLKFQREEPLVHEIFMGLELLVRMVAERILKAEVSSESVRRPRLSLVQDRSKMTKICFLCWKFLPL